MKVCKQCGLEKDASSFGKWALGKDGLKIYCRECISEGGKKYRDTHQEQIQESGKKYRATHREQIKKYFAKNYVHHPMNIVTFDRIREFLSYDNFTGIFKWIKKPHGHLANIGDVAGSISKRDGYQRITFAGKSYLSHRLAWYFVYNEWPSKNLDHIDNDRLNNRVENLRLATYSQNASNRSKKKNNKVGLKGVYQRPSGKFLARIEKDNKRYRLGTFDDPFIAYAAYCEAANKLHGEFARG